MTDDVISAGELRLWARDAFAGHHSRSVSQLQTWSGDPIAETGSGNTIVCDASCNLPIRFCLPGSSGNTVYAEKMEQVHGSISITGTNNTIIVCGGGAWQSQLGIHVNGNNSTLYIGRDCTFNQTDMFLTGDDVEIICGKDCMFSHATMIRTYDQHAIFDVATGTWCNAPQSVVVGSHTWVGQEALLLKGTRIGKGSIIGAKASVSGTVPAMTLSVGVPARVIRSGVSWIREMSLTEDRMASVMDLLR